MKKAEWTSEDGRFHIVFKVYATKRGVNAEYNRLHPEKAGVDTCGFGSVFHRVDFTDGNEVDKATCFISIWQKFCTPGIVAHEAEHVSQALSDLFPVEGIDRWELACQYLDTIVDLFWPWLEKYGLLVKRSNNWHQGLMW